MHEAVFYSEGIMSIQQNRYKMHTFFCLYLMASFSRLRVILSPCWQVGPKGSWFSKISSSLELRVWSSKAVAKFITCFLSAWSQNKLINFDFYQLKLLTKYSLLNSCSEKASLLSSHESSKAVSIGSLLDRAIKEGEAKALQALILRLECLRLSSLLDSVQSSHPHLIS